MMLTEGTPIREYRLISKLSHRLYSQIWIAANINTGNQVALTVFLYTQASSAEQFRNLQNKTNVMRSSTHPNIVNVIDIFIHGDQCVMVMQIVPGISLKVLIASIGPIPYKRYSRIFTQILEALHYIHERGITHSDLKPSNIMVDVDHDDTVKLLDMGISLDMIPCQTFQSEPETMTINYLSPERIKDWKSFDHRSDIFGLGVVLYEMLTGSRPFGRDESSDYQIMCEIVNVPLPDPRQIYPYIPQRIIGILNKMCEKDPDRRFQSIRDVQRAFCDHDSD